MMHPMVLVAAVAICSALGPGAQPEAAAAESHLESLLRARDEQRIAHRTGEVDRLLATLADPFVNIDDGELRHLGRHEFGVMMERYLGRVEFLEWDDAYVPVVAMSDDETLAHVLVQKRVRLVADEQARAVRFAWAENWRRSGDEWLMVAITSTEKAPEPYEDGFGPARDAAAALARAREWLGGENAIHEVAMTAFSADCRGPRGPYRTEVVSSRDGRFRFAQEFPDRPAFSMGRSLDGAWIANGDGVSSEVSNDLVSIAYGHEWTLLPLAPESRFRAPIDLGELRFDGRETEAIRFLDLLGEEAILYLDSETGQPAGLELHNPTDRGPARVETRFTEWKRSNGIRFPAGVEIVHGDERFRCEIEARAGWFPDESFGP